MDKARREGKMRKIIYFIILLILINTASAYRIMDILEQAKPVSHSGYELEAIYISDNKVKFRLDQETSDIFDKAHCATREVAFPPLLPV